MCQYLVATTAYYRKVWHVYVFSQAVFLFNNQCVFIFYIIYDVHCSRYSITVGP
jgi:hypothetical protein